LAALRRGGGSRVDCGLGGWDVTVGNAADPAGSAYADGVGELEVRVIPRARREEIAGERGGRLLIRLTAPPVDGAANAALCRLVARRAGVPVRRVSIVRGQTARDKVVRVEGLSEGELRAAMAS
jgi:uncharacterized protein